MNLLTSIPLHFIAVWQMAAERQSDTMRSNCGSEYEAKVCHWIAKIAPIDIHRWLLNVSGDQMVDFSIVKDVLHGQHFHSNDAIIAVVKQWATSTGADLYQCSMQALVHCWWKCTPNGGDYVEKCFCSWEFALSNIGVIVLFASVVVSMEINSRHYFQSNVCVCACTCVHI